MSGKTAKPDWGLGWQSVNSGNCPINLDKWKDKGVAGSTLSKPNMAININKPIVWNYLWGISTNGTILDLCQRQGNRNGRRERAFDSRTHTDPVTPLSLTSAAAYALAAMTLYPHFPN